MTIKGNNWYIHDFLQAVGNTASTSFSFDAAAIAFFLYFDNNMLSLITSLTKLIFPQFQFPRYIPVLCSPFFSVWKPKGIPMSEFLLQISYSLKPIKLTHSLRFSYQKLTSKNWRVTLYANARFELPYFNKKRRCSITLPD